MVLIRLCTIHAPLPVTNTCYQSCKDFKIVFNNCNMTTLNGVRDGGGGDLLLVRTLRHHEVRASFIQRECLK